MHHYTKYLKIIKPQIKEVLTKIIENDMYSDWKIKELDELEKGQYYGMNLWSLIEHDTKATETIIGRTFLYLQTNEFLNPDFNINEFYSNNTKVIEEFNQCLEDELFNDLLEVYQKNNLDKYDDLNDSELYLSEPELLLFSKVKTSSQVKQDRMNEDLFSIGFLKDDLRFTYNDFRFVDLIEYKTLDNEGNMILVTIDPDKRKFFPEFIDEIKDFKGNNFKCFKIGTQQCPKAPQQNDKRVFIGMPFRDKYEDIYEHGINEALQKLKLKPYRADKDTNNIDLMCKICEAIQSSKYGIINLTDWNANVLFELGILYGLGKQVALIKDKNSDVPVDLTGIEYIEYSKSSDVKDSLISLFENKFIGS